MPNWRLAKSLLKLREQLNAAYPHRSAYNPAAGRTDLALASPTHRNRSSCCMRAQVYPRIPSSAVLRHSNRFKVLRSYAASVVAKVVNLVGSGNRPDPKFVGVSVSNNFPPSTIANNGEMAVASRFLAARPEPAGLGLVDKQHESLMLRHVINVRLSCSQGVNLHRLGLALVRPVHSLTRVFGPSCILTRERRILWK